MSADDLEKYEAELELALYKEYRDLLPMFKYLVETDRRSYLCNEYSITRHDTPAGPWFEIVLKDAWAWDYYRQDRFVSQVKINTANDVNIEDVARLSEKHPLEELER